MNTEKFKQVYNESRNGCNEFYRNPLYRALRYSDGVRDLAETGCWWLLDIVGTEVVDMFRKAPEDDRHAAFYAKVHDSTAELRLEFHDGSPAWKRRIEWTDMPDGEWCFLLANEGQAPRMDIAMILPTEH